MTRSPLFAAGATVIALAVAGCGGSGSSSSSATRSPASNPPTTSSSATTSSAISSSATSAAGGSGGASATHTTGSAAASAGATKLALAAQPSGMLMFTKKTLEAKAGTITVVFTNNSPLAHNLTIQKGTNGPIVGSTPTFQGGVKTLTLKLAAGTYTFFCSVPGHRMAGMQGTLTVT